MNLNDKNLQLKQLKLAFSMLSFFSFSVFFFFFFFNEVVTMDQADTLLHLH